MRSDLISQTLAPDNKTNWFHKSPREQIACYELWQRDFSKIRREEFCTASFLSSHLFNLSPSFLSKAAPKQRANKSMRSPWPLQLSITQMRLLVFNLWVIACVMGRLVNTILSMCASVYVSKCNPYFHYKKTAQWRTSVCEWQPLCKMTALLWGSFIKAGGTI